MISQHCGTVAFFFLTFRVSVQIYFRLLAPLLSGMKSGHVSVFRLLTGTSVAYILLTTPIRKRAGISHSVWPGFYSRHGQDFSFLHNVQAGSGAQPACYPLGTGASYPGGKAGRT
jgi:hypothetical protein